jgi:hypothetical protein
LYAGSSELGQPVDASEPALLPPGGDPTDELNRRFPDQNAPTSGSAFFDEFNALELANPEPYSPGSGSAFFAEANQLLQEQAQTWPYHPGSFEAAFSGIKAMDSIAGWLLADLSADPVGAFLLGIIAGSPSGMKLYGDPATQLSEEHQSQLPDIGGGVAKPIDAEGDYPVIFSESDYTTYRFKQGFEVPAEAGVAHEGAHVALAGLFGEADPKDVPLTQVIAIVAEALAAASIAARRPRP